jgi:putative membrane protein
MKWIVKWMLCAGALLLVAQIYSGVQLQNFTAALIAALVLGLFNTLLRPVLIVLTLPITVVTLGLFLFVIHAVTFWAASGMLDGFAVAGFEAALIGSVLYSLLCIVIDSALEQLFPPQ